MLSKRPKAFTLVEMLVILVLLTLITALALPNLGKSYNQIQLQSTVNRLQYTMRYAQSRAITQNKNIKLVFENSFRKYKLLENNPQSTSMDYTALTGTFGKTTRVPENITVESAAPSLIFFPNGSIEKTNIQLCEKKNCMIVSTQQQRGEIEVFETQGTLNAKT